MSRIIDADKLKRELSSVWKWLVERDNAGYGTTFGEMMDKVHEIINNQPRVHEDFVDDLLNMGYTKGYNKALDDLISKAEDERDNIYNWEDDEYENGMRVAYQDMIEMAQHWKEGEKNGDRNSGNP